MRLQNWSEQEGAKAHRNASLGRQRANAHGRWVGVGRTKLEPEIERRCRHERFPSGAALREFKNLSKSPSKTL